MCDDRMSRVLRPSHDPLRGELERLGPKGRDVLVLGLDSPGFGDLSTNHKIFAYYMYRAAIAGDAIMYMQSHRHALEIKHLLESIYTHSDGMKPGLKTAVHDYLKLIWVHHGNYYHSTRTKFVPHGLTARGLEQACDAALRNGAALTGSGESPPAKLERLRRTIFDREYEPIQSNTAPGVDAVAASAVNFWDRGVTQAEIEALPPEWRNKINVRFARRDGHVVPEPYKIGGLYSRELETISHFLRLALPFAETPEQKASIELLLEFYQTGDEDTFREHCVQWLKSDTIVDYLNGFIEHYIDPRGIIGSFEGNVSYTAEETVADGIADNALYFEQRMPWPDQYKRSRIDKPVAKVVNVLVETGDAGPVSPAAYNLPNYNDIRRDHGSKNVMFLNVENTSSPELLEKLVDEFYLPEYRENVLKYAQSKVRPLEVYMHEIIGHGSGQPDPDLEVDPRAALGRIYSPLEECRADLAALYHMSDPKLIEIGALTEDEQAEIVETAYITYTQGWLTRVDRVDGLEVREAHNKGHHLILMYLLENGGDPNKDFGLEIIKRGKDFFVRLRDAAKVREGLRELLYKLQVMKSTGDARAASALFDGFARRVHPEWKENMVERLKRLNIPRLKAFVFSHLTPRIEAGKVVDVRIAHDEDLTAQQLRFSRLHNVTDIAAD
ncbi:MAG: hypothetical protein ACE5EO_06605 [Candidatus Krumholzibacteriia bacterium]